MVTNTCPACGQPLAPSDINIKEGVALCRSCGKLSKLSEIAAQPAVDAKALAAPPKGCSYREEINGDLLVRVSLRSLGAAAGTLAICLFWNGIVSVFVLIAVAGLYTHFIGPIPKWFPAPSSSGRHGNVNADMPLGMTLFLCVFLTPFVVIGLALLLAFLTCLMGRIEMIVRCNDGRVRTGFGPFNVTRRFDASNVKKVGIGYSSFQSNGQNKPVIQIDADRTVKFGSMLPDERRAWLLGLLHVVLVTREKAALASLGLSPAAR